MFLFTIRYFPISGENTKLETEVDLLANISISEINKTSKTLKFLTKNYSNY